MRIMCFSPGIGHCQDNCTFQNLLKSLDLANGSKVRPMKDWRNTSLVYLDFTLYTIVDLDMNEQTAISYVWFYMSWKDEFANWNPNDFCGIQKLFVPNDYFWKPDLYIYEMIDSGDNAPEVPFYKLQSSGKITNAMPLRIVSSCNLDIFKFPFDNQTCRLSFGSYVYTVADLIMWPKSNSSIVNQNSLNVFASKGDWSLQAVTVYNTTYVSTGEGYSQVIYSIYLKRSSIVYVINLIIPACFLVFLDIASMFIQAYGERLAFKITIVLGFSVLLLILNDMLPNSDNTPMLGIFCCICMGMMVLSIIGTVSVSYMLDQSTTNASVPLWVRTLVLNHLAYVACFKKTAFKDEPVSIIVSGKDSDNEKKIETQQEISNNERHLEKEMNANKEVKLLKRLLVEILKIHQELMLARKTTEDKSDWTMVAHIVDRLVLILYLITVSLIFVIMICVWAI
ncbi:5-hydroxytryptamine receptor 3A-like [Mixophyes fleayi]|uniref:5-hydroxytryptamine receptor 3A-like n=1 Tax=Mixophyes fleayi TaxID=3061075 RepID=UPI003F4E3325